MSSPKDHYYPLCFALLSINLASLSHYCFYIYIYMEPKFHANSKTSISNLISCVNFASLFSFLLSLSLSLYLTPFLSQLHLFFVLISHPLSLLYFFSLSLFTFGSSCNFYVYLCVCDSEFVHLCPTVSFILSLSLTKTFIDLTSPFTQ